MYTRLCGEHTASRSVQVKVQRVKGGVRSKPGTIIVLHSTLKCPCA
jgi:hypothetical protein